MRRRQRAGGVVVFALSLSAAACVATTSAEPLAYSAERRIDGINGVALLSPGVTADDVEYLEKGLRTVSTYFRTRLQTVLPEPITIRMATPESCLGNSRSTGGSTADTLCVWAGSPTWARLKAKPTDAIALVAHEHVHNFQAQLGCLPQDRREYRWFTEGMAVYLSWRALLTEQLATPADYQDWRARYTQAGQPLLSLSRYAANVPDDRAYDLAAQAVEELARRGLGDASLVAFCRAAERDWRSAFQTQFGVGVDDLIARFDAENNLPERR